MTERTADLDVVVLGGGGHVGLPLSLAFAQAGLRVGIYDTNQATLDRIAARRDAVPRDRRRRAARARSCRPAASRFGADGAMIARTDAPRRRHRHAGRRVPRPVDDDLREGRRPDRAAPPRRRAGRPAQHGLPGHDRLRRRSTSPSAAARVDVAFCPERIAEGHALEELALAAPDRRRRRRRAPATAPRRCSARWRAKTIRTTHQGGRAGEAVHQHLALHEVRGRQPVLHDRRPGRRRLHEHPARDPRGLPARGGPARARASPPARACSRTRCSWPPSRPTTSRSARPRCRSTRACRPTSSSALERRYGGLAGQDASGSSGWPSRPSRTTPARRSATSCASCSSWAGARVLCTDPYVVDDRLVPLDGVLAESDILVLGAPHKPYRGLEVGGKDVVDVWGALGEGIRL